VYISRFGAQVGSSVRNNVSRFGTPPPAGSPQATKAEPQRGSAFPERFALGAAGGGVLGHLLILTLSGESGRIPCGGFFCRRLWHT